MIANRIVPTVSEDTFVIRYLSNDAEVLSLASDYQTISFVLHNCPFTPLELFDIMIPRHLCGVLDEVNMRVTERVLGIRLGGSENLFELDFSYFNFVVLGLDGVRDFIFNNEALAYHQRHKKV